MKNRNKMTKFPVARIKKIMQKDEEVGKVAQATPIVISKALELFLSMMIDRACEVTTSRGSKKVEAYHLKHAIETTEMLDFLKEIVQAVPDPSAGGTVDLELVDAETSTSTGAKRSRKGKKVNPDSATVPQKRRRRKKEEKSTEMVVEEGDGGGAVEEEESEHRPYRREENWDDDDENGD